MDPEKDVGKSGTEPQPQPEPPPKRDASGRTVAPPIEREHETLEGALEEDEKREHEPH
jgi:hypothetical protein